MSARYDEQMSTSAMMRFSLTILINMEQRVFNISFCLLPTVLNEVGLSVSNIVTDDR